MADEAEIDARFGKRFLPATKFSSDVSCVIFKGLTLKEDNELEIPVIWCILAISPVKLSPTEIVCAKDSAKANSNKIRQKAYFIVNTISGAAKL